MLHCYTVDIVNCHYNLKEVRKIMIEGKGLGGKKVNRVNVSLSNKYDTKLKRLATACNLKPTTLAYLLIERCLDDPLIVSDLQDGHAVHAAYRVYPIKNYVTGELEYVLNEKG